MDTLQGFGNQSLLHAQKIYKMQQNVLKLWGIFCLTDAGRNVGFTVTFVTVVGT